MFTSHHLPLVKLAYETHVGPDVIRLITKTISFYPGMKNQSNSRPFCDLRLPPPAYINVESGLTNRVTTSEALEYEILCGLCHLSLQDWQAASDAFERAMTFPTTDSGCSKIMVDAHNKWVLVSLLLKGKLPPVPTSAGAGAQRTFTILGKPYVAIAKAFEQRNGGAQALKAAVEETEEQVWIEDGNLGLIRLVLAYYQRWQILNLREVYSKISIEEIRRCTQSAETGEELKDAGEVEALLHGMISTGTLSGVIKKPPAGAIAGDGQGYLTFLPQVDELSEALFAAEILASTKRVKDLEPVVKATSDRLALSREYARFLVKEQRLEELESSKDGGIGLFDSQIEDEDLMAGVVGTGFQ